MDGNACGEGACRALSGALKCNVALETLGLFGCGISPEGGGHLASGLEENVSLLNLLMSDNDLGPIGGLALAQALVLNQSLTRLWPGVFDATKHRERLGPAFKMPARTPQQG